MIFEATNAADKRAKLRQSLRDGNLLQFPGAFSPFVALIATELGFDGIYISGSTIASDLGLPDIGLTTQSEVVQRGRAIANVTALPSIIDIDTGFGEPMNVARTVRELEQLGLAGCHLEDQANPKRCGHLDNKELVAVDQMTKKLRAAADIRADKNFLLIGRTDARAEEGVAKAIDRAKAYVDAGADVIFPEALQNIAEFEQFRKAISAPLLANMTEFGKSPLLSKTELEGVGFNIVIYPVTAFRLAMKAVEDGFRTLQAQGSQAALVPQMQTRARLYEVLKYESYNRFDQKLFNFKLP